MFDVCYSDDHHGWLIYKDGKQWSPYTYKGEFEAIDDVRRVDPVAADELDRLHSSVH